MRDVRMMTAAGRRTECRAYQIWDGFDNYNGSSELWPSVSGTPAYSSSYCRFPTPTGLLGQGIRFPGNARKLWNLNGNQATLIFGFAFLCETLPLTNYGGILQLIDVGNAQCQISVGANGALALMAATTLTSPLAQSATAVIFPFNYYWVDVVISINNTTGSVSIYLNQPKGGAALLTATGLDTQATADAYANQFAIGDLSNKFSGIRFDDFHCHDNGGSFPNAVLGDSRIYTKKANGAGYATNWTPNGAAANWQCSDDSPPDGDTTYNSSNTPGAIDGLAVPGAGFTVAPNGLVRRSYVRRDDAGPHTFQNGIRSSGTNALGTAVTVPSAYAWFDGLTCYVNDPATGSPWATAAAADAATMVVDETS